MAFPTSCTTSTCDPSGEKSCPADYEQPNPDVLMSHSDNLNGLDRFDWPLCSSLYFLSSVTTHSSVQTVRCNLRHPIYHSRSLTCLARAKGLSQFGILKYAYDLHRDGQVNHLLTESKTRSARRMLASGETLVFDTQQ